MGSSKSRRVFRLQSGVNRKLTAIRWMNAWTVRVDVSKTKADEGAEKSFYCRRKRRVRGQRRGRSRSRGGKPRSNDPPRPSNPDRSSARFLRHSGRKFLWYEQVAKKLCFSGTASYLARFPLRGARPGKEVRQSASWLRFNHSADRFLARSQIMGIPIVAFGEGNPWELLKTRRPEGGDLDGLMAALAGNLPVKDREEQVPAPILIRTRSGPICRLCGARILPYVLHGTDANGRRVCPSTVPPSGGTRRSFVPKGSRGGRGRRPPAGLGR